ncbi:MAG: rod shape-determining protein MreC [Burkholderiaceae bacterium]|jgi:rod shape-determining protein MreC|nr:rod shape-determining protein MreC [Burkholderiaceae bacterium]
MQSGPPPLFNQGVSARARLAFFSFLAIALIVVDSRVKALETVRLGLGVALYPLQQAMQVPGELVERVGQYFTSVAALSRENESLKRQAVERASQLVQAEQLRVENEQLRKLLSARARVDSPGVVAQVMYESRDRFSRKLVIDKGSSDSLKPGQPVIDAVGVVGQVTRVFPVTSEVTLITDKEQTIPVQVLRNGLRGVAYGGVEPGTLDLRFMASNADINQGDVAVTSGLDGVYPAGLPVATVARVERNVRDQFARIVLMPSAGVHSNAHVLVLTVDPSTPARPPEAEKREARKGARK